MLIVHLVKSNQHHKKDDKMLASLNQLTSLELRIASMQFHTAYGFKGLFTQVVD